VALLGGCLVLVTGCGQEQSAQDTVQETRALENTSNKVGNSINDIMQYRPAYEEGRPAIKQANLDVFWMNMTSTRLGLGRFLRDLEASPQLVDVGRNLWIGRIQGALDRAEATGTFAADGEVARRLGEAFGKDRVVEELRKIVELKSRIQTVLSIQGGTPDTGS
tara:strand:- start:894 stop:1385 length:492 start_codon:yes stop_codon:yes gene_type:complete